MNWFKTPPESPDLNPIENVHEMKEFLRREVKPQNKAELVAGIEEFGEVSRQKSVDVISGTSGR